MSWAGFIGRCEGISCCRRMCSCEGRFGLRYPSPNAAAAREAFRHWRAARHPPLRDHPKLLSVDGGARALVTSVCRVFAHWALGQDGRAPGGARRADGTGRRDGRRAEHPVESCDFCPPGHRSLRLPLQEAHLRDMDDSPSRSNVSTSQIILFAVLQFQGLLMFYYNSATYGRHRFLPRGPQCVACKQTRINSNFVSYSQCIWF